MFDEEKVAELIASRLEKQGAVLLRVDQLELHPFLLQAIEKGSNVTGVYDDLPLEQLLVLEQYAEEFPGLRWILRKQRGRYLLTILSGKHLKEKAVRGEP